MPYLDLTRRLACVAALAGALCAPPAHATVIQGDVLHSVSHTGATFLATLTYIAATDTSATLTIDLQNTSLAGVGGSLTAFVLNNPGDKISSVTLGSAPANFSQLGLGNVNGAPFGRFDFGATTGNGFEGIGNTPGVIKGTPGSFTFNLGGTGLSSLTADSFLSAFSVPPGAGQGTQFFAARFGGTDLSDKVPASPIPEIPPFAALIPGVMLLALRLRRRIPPS